MSRHIIKNARELVGTEKGRVEKLIADLEAKLHKQEELVRKNELENIRLQGLMNVYKERADELKKNRRKLQEENTNVRIFSIGACYDSGPNTSTWNFRPDYEAQEVEEILQIVDHIGRSLI